MKSSPDEYNAIIGDSKLLCVLTKAGQMRRLFWPHIDYGQHVELFKIGLQVFSQKPKRQKNRGPGALDQNDVLWLTERGWTHSQQYAKSANVVATWSEHKRARISSAATAFAVPGCDSLIFEYSITNLAAKPREFRLGLYALLRIDESPFNNTALFDEGSGSLVFYLRDVAVAISGAGKIAGYHCGVAGEESSALRRNRWNLAGSTIQHKNPDGAVAWDLGRLEPGEAAPITLYISAGKSISEATSKSTALNGADQESRPRGASRARGSKLRASVETAWKDWLKGAEPEAAVAKLGDSRGSFSDSLRPRIKAKGIGNRPSRADLVKKLGRKGQELYERSLLTLKLLTDRETGAIIAAAEFDREREACGGYGYCWGRDGAFNAYALGLAGMLEEAEAFFEFAQRAQESDGVWLHRHYASGELAPSWGLVQIDETGAILWAAYEHFRMTGSRAFLRSRWESINRAASYLARSIDPETGLPLPSFELWEEQLCESVYSAAAVTGGLRAAAGWARALGKIAEARLWSKGADEMREAILRTLWDPKAKSFLKSAKKSIAESAFKRGGAAGSSDYYIEVADGQIYPEYIQSRDHTTDSSLLGLAFPFDVLAPRDEMMRQAAATVARRLWSRKVGGIMRYEGDRYVGGNPWILTTLWLAIYYLESGATPRAIRLIKWAIDHATDAGLLTEQVDKRTGNPIWAVPLGWSHAMYIIAALKLSAS